MDNFVRDRLADRLDRYPKTTLLFLGEEGLRNRNLWKGEIKQFAEDHGVEISGDWLNSYKTWRTDLAKSLLGT
jgi:hypothetical protein